MPEFETVPTPHDPAIPSVLMCVGSDPYKLHKMISEYSAWGVSKRIPSTAIPEGLVPYKSKIFVAHEHAILRVRNSRCTLVDLAVMLEWEGLLSAGQNWAELLEIDTRFWQGDALGSAEFVPGAMLNLAIALDSAEPDLRRKIIKEFDIEFCMGVVGFSYIERVEYICKPGEEELPEELAHLEGYVTPVRVVKTDDEGSPYMAHSLNEEEEDNGN
jgi:hypothetical protein